MPRLLSPGGLALQVWTDASALNELGVGAWAFHVANFDLYGDGIEPAEHIEKLELTGAVQAIEAISRVDATARPIWIHIDCAFAHGVLKRLAESQELPVRQSFDRIRDLAQRARVALGDRKLVSTLCDRAAANHRRVHVAARAAIRRHVQNNVKFRAEQVIEREERRLSEVLKQRTKVEADLLRLDLEVKLAEMRVEALRYAWRGEIQAN